MNDIELRKFQEAMANFLLMKDELAKSMFELYRAYQKAGFTKGEALELIECFVKGDNR